MDSASGHELLREASLRGVAWMLLATSLVNAGAVLQKKALDRLPDLRGVSLLQSLRGMLGAPAWLGGWLLASLGVVLNMHAVGLADLSVVQPLNGFGLVVLALLSRWLLGERLDRPALAGMALVGAGVVLVGLALPPSRAFDSAAELLGLYLRPGAWLGLGGGALVAAALALRSWRGGSWAGVGFALAAATSSVVGLSFAKGVFGLLGLGGLGAVLAPGPLGLAALLLLFSSAALALQQLSFQQGRAVEVVPAFSAASVLLPLPLGALVFGEALPASTLLAALLVAVGVLLLGGREERVPGYHGLDELERRLAACAGRRPGARLERVGESVEGRPLLLLRVPGEPGEEGPWVLVLANIHGNELVAGELALELAERLCAEEPGEEARELLRRASVALLPVANPDGRARSLEALRGRRWRASRANARGVDLNRNFPPVEGARESWNPLAGTRHRGLPWYRGPEPLSEPESRAIARLAEELRPLACLDLHSVGRRLLHPWAWTAEPPAALEAFRELGRAFTSAQARPYRVQQSHAWYPILGDLDDWLHHRFGTLAVTVELSAPLMALRERPTALLWPAWWMNPARPGPTIENTAGPGLRLLRRAVELRGGGGSTAG